MPFIYYCAIGAINMALCRGRLLPSRVKKWKYNPMCVEDEESINNMLSEELDIVSGDEINLENEGQSESKELSNTSESECESETSAVCIDGWEDVTMGNKKFNAYTFTKMQSHNFIFHQMQGPWFILIYFSMRHF
jgi:hypothetical protein